MGVPRVMVDSRLLASRLLSSKKKKIIELSIELLPQGTLPLNHNAIIRQFNWFLKRGVELPMKLMDATYSKFGPQKRRVFYRKDNDVLVDMKVLVLGAILVMRDNGIIAFDKVKIIPPLLKINEEKITEAFIAADRKMTYEVYNDYVTIPVTFIFEGKKLKVDEKLIIDFLRYFGVGPLRKDIETVRAIKLIESREE